MNNRSSKNMKGFRYFLCTQGLLNDLTRIKKNKIAAYDKGKSGTKLRQSCVTEEAQRINAAPFVLWLFPGTPRLSNACLHVHLST